MFILGDILGNTKVHLLNSVTVGNMLMYYKTLSIFNPVDLALALINRAVSCDITSAAFN